MMMLVLFPFFLHAGDKWKLRKDQNGIQVYTREQEDSRVYMYKVQAKIDYQRKKVFEQVIDFQENLKYMELVDSMAFLDHRENKRYINYLRFNLPWPVKNREMVMDMKVWMREGTIRIVSDDSPDALEGNGDMVPVEDFHEEWTIETGVYAGETLITITGWVNPGGAIPAWVVNVFSVRIPFRFISGILKEIRKEYQTKK